MQPGQNTAGRHALIISLTPVSDEPRVKRQAWALHDAGWRVSVAGFRGTAPVPGFWQYVEIAHVGLGLTPRHHASRWLNQALCRFSEAAAERAYWSAVSFDGIYQHLAYVETADYDLILGHDWMTAPLAARLGRTLGVPYSIDVHEYAIGQYLDNWRWRLWSRPLVHGIQKRFLPAAGALTTICDGFADLLQADYSLTERPTVVRSVAQHGELPFRPTGERITLLYHGILAPTRGLEEAIASTAHWQPDRALLIRGGGPAEFIQHLSSLADELGVSDRVTIEDPVPSTEMIERAHADADLGFCMAPNVYSPQRKFALGNKFFEYVTAGLGLFVSDLPEMARLVNEYDLGVLVSDPTPEGIAQAFNGLDREAIDVFKRNSLDAARSLNWDTEKEIMLELYDRLVPERELTRPGSSAATTR